MCSATLDTGRRRRVPDVPPLTGVAEIVLNVRDLPTMRTFYRDVLGFPVLREACHEVGRQLDPDGEPTITFLVITDVVTPLGRHGHPQLLALIDYRRHAHAAVRFEGHDPHRSTLNHLAFEIPPDSYAAHKQRLEGLGITPTEAEFPSMQARALFFDDPEGNLLELICHAPAPDEAATLDLEGIVETTLFVADLGRARRFYERVLRLRTVQESDTGCVFRIGPHQVLLLVTGKKAKQPSRTPGGEIPPSHVRGGDALGAGHVAFGVTATEFDRWRSGLAAQGVDVLNEVTWETGARSLYFRDPDGHLLELCTPGVWKEDAPGNR